MKGVARTFFPRRRDGEAGEFSTVLVVWLDQSQQVQILSVLGGDYYGTWLITTVVMALGSSS